MRRANERGHANHGWLDSYHSFSFANYYNPEHMGFRALRVINEDRVAGGKGFGTHPHSDFEIISYVISGALRHQDSMGHQAVMKAGDVQRISAGTGIAHSEYNNSPEEPVHFLQIWIQPEYEGATPDYAQKSFANVPLNRLTLACSGDWRDGSIKINQNTDLFIGKLAAKGSLNHRLAAHRFAWVQLIQGDLDLNGVKLAPGDGASLNGEAELNFASAKGAHFLLFDLD